jgi:hypothetical protein
MERTANETPSPKKRRAAPKEKRAHRYRSKSPAKLCERILRARTQRLYLISKEKINEGTYKLTVLGSTGNVYEVTLGHVPSCTCPDYQRKQDLCKHILFVSLKVLGLSVDNPLVYQKALVTEELDDVFWQLENRRTGGVVDANQQVKAAVAQMRGQEVPESPSPIQRKQLDDDNRDCPICFDQMEGPEGTVYCRSTCGTNFHADCIRRWLGQHHQSRGEQTCPACRQPWLQEGGTAAVASPTTTTREGYVNLGAMQGQSPLRDTSTYHTGAYYYANKRRRYC